MFDGLMLFEKVDQSVQNTVCMNVVYERQGFGCDQGATHCGRTDGPE